MSMCKTSVSLLQEYCAKYGLPSPTYIIENDESSFVCKTELRQHSATGKGRSKREAKHESARKLLAKIHNVDTRELQASVGLLCPPKLPVEPTTPASDMVDELKKKCMQYAISLPEIVTMHQADILKFICRCKVSSITRYGVADNKKDARQQAAKRLLDIIASMPCVSEQNLNATVPYSSIDDAVHNAMWHELEGKRSKVIKSYSEITKSYATSKPNNLKFSEEHMFFTLYPDHMKKAALQLIACDKRCDKMKVNDLFNILNITPTVREMLSLPDTDMKGVPFPNVRRDNMLYIELNVEVECAFFGQKDAIYKEILEFFEEMLV